MGTAALVSIWAGLALLEPVETEGSLPELCAFHLGPLNLSLRCAPPETAPVPAQGTPDPVALSGI